MQGQGNVFFPKSDLTTYVLHTLKKIYYHHSGGATVTREDKVKQVLDEILEKLPEEFNMAEIMGKVEERTPYVNLPYLQ